MLFNGAAKPKTDREPKKFLSRRRKESIFLFFLLLYPVAHFLIFYVGVNINSILLAFKTFDIDTGIYSFSGFNNFTKFFRELVNEPIMLVSLKNALLLYAVGLVIGVPLNILIAYAVFHKVPMSGVFRVIIFLPQIISSIVFVLIFKYFLDYGMPQVLMKLFHITKPPNLLMDPRYAFPTIIFYGLWTGFGMGIIIYTNAMTRISDSLIEFGKLEGISPLKELWFVVIPMIFPTISTFLVTGVAGLFMSSGAVYSFFGDGAQMSLYTFGYWLFVKVVGGSVKLVDYPYAASAGLVFTLVAAPITLVVKWALEKFGPNPEY